MESKIEMALRHVLEGRRIIKRQTTLVDHLRAKSADTSAAERLLDRFQRSLAIFEHDYWELMTQSRRVEAFPGRNGALLADLLEVLVTTAIEHADGKARAAFYLADGAGAELHHIIGMPHAYARYVDGFSIGTQSLACGLAVATRQPVITRDVREEQRWKPWLWLAEEFHYRACWSFPVVICSGKVLGSFAMYYEGPREATMRDLDLVSALTRTAATIISRN